LTAIFHQLQGLYTAGDVLCAVDCVRALPDHRHVVFVNHDRSFDRNVLTMLEDLGADVRREALVGLDDLTGDVRAVIYHCVGYDDQLRGEFVRFDSAPDGVALWAWIHTPGRCGQVAERYGHLRGRPISRLLLNSSFSLHNTPGLEPWQFERCAIVHPSIDTARFAAISREPDGCFRGGRWSRGADGKYSDDFLALLDELAIEGAEYLCMGIPPKFRGAPTPHTVQLLENGAVPLEKFLARLDVLIFKTDEKSWHEGFCRTVTEAMAAGVVPVVENRGGIPDQVTHGYNGYLCDSNDDFARFCRLLHADPDLRAQLSANARQSVAEMATLERLRSDLERLLEPTRGLRLDIDDAMIGDLDPFRPKLPVPDDACDEIEAYHVLEHVADKRRILEEVWRIARHNAVIRIKLPDRRHSDAFVDPTHCSYWEVDTIDFFVPGHRRTAISRAAFGVLRKFTTGREIFWELVAMRHRPWPPVAQLGGVHPSDRR
jgi:glycosyltransferase involved in cell wall biosynthesis